MSIVDTSESDRGQFFSGTIRVEGGTLFNPRRTVYLKTTNEDNKVQPFAGRITVEQGTIAHPRRLNDERDDRLHRTGPNTLDFRFETADGVAGLKFDLNGGQRVVFHLDFLGHRTQDIYFGGREIEAHEDPLVFNLNR